MFELFFLALILKCGRKASEIIGHDFISLVVSLLDVIIGSCVKKIHS